MKKRICACLLLCLIMVVGIKPMSSSGVTMLLPTACDNLQTNLRAYSELVQTDGGYMRVFYDGEKIQAEDYDGHFNLINKRTIPMELTYWGGFYAGEEAFFIVTGQANTEENNHTEVIRVIKYDKNWNRLGAASITSNADLFGGDVRYPFDYGCVEMTEHNGMLYIVTGHQGYVDEAVGQGHQGFLMIAVDEDTMTGGIVDCDLWHSFAQHIENDQNHLYVLEQSEGSGYTKLSQYNITTLESKSIPVLEYGGSRTSVWAVKCYASVDDLALSKENVLCIGTSIDQSKYDEVSSNTAHNIYLTITPKADFIEERTTVKWLTDYVGGGKSFLGVKLTKINDDRFMISWEEASDETTPVNDDTLAGYTLHYLFIDGSGNALSQVYTAAAPISDCSPIVVGDKVVYYASSANMVNFYTIGVHDGSFNKKAYRVAGETATWTLKGSMLTVSGEGAIDVNLEAGYRSPVSSASNIFSYSSSDNAWKPISSKVKKIVIEEGLTSISDNAFSGFPNLEEVVIKPGMKTIGEKAFYGCEKLKKITIPASVTKIGKDFLWTGYYWMDDSHVVYAKIYTPENSYAAKYAKQNKIYAELSHDYGTWKVIKKATNKADGKMRRDCKLCDEYETKTIYKASAVKLSFSKSAYNGKTKSPKIVVKDSKGKVISEEHYIVTTPKGRKNVGKYPYKITFKKRYKGTKTLYLTVNPTSTEIKKLTAMKKGFKVTWNKVSKQASGYEIAYATNSKFTKNKKVVKVKGVKNTSKKITKLAAKKTYYVKVRTYKVVDGKTYYAKWSKAKKVKI